MAEWGVCCGLEGNRAVTSSSGGDLLVWDIRTARVEKKIPGDGSWIVALRMTPDELFCLSASLDGKLRLRDLRTGKTLTTMAIDVDDDILPNNQLAICPDAKLAVSANRWSAMGWNLKSGQPLGEFSSDDARINAIALAPDCRHAIAAFEDGMLSVWDVQDGSAVADFTVEHPLRLACLSGDGRTVIAGDAIGQIHILRIEY
jgi:WD40 repeat protein